jgi:hypothetical protein
LLFARFASSRTLLQSPAAAAAAEVEAVDFTEVEAVDFTGVEAVDFTGVEAGFTAGAVGLLGFTVGAVAGMAAGSTGLLPMVARPTLVMGGVAMH